MGSTSTHWSALAQRIQSRLLALAWNEKRGAFTAAIGSDELYASLLLLPEIGLINATDPRFVSTLEGIERELLRGKHVMRYVTEDNFGLPEFGFPGLPVLADRCLVEARTTRGG